MVYAQSEIAKLKRGEDLADMRELMAQQEQQAEDKRKRKEERKSMMNLPSVNADDDHGDRRQGASENLDEYEEDEGEDGDELPPLNAHDLD